MNIELMKLVEIVVRPIHAPVSRKLRMREELYSQLEQIHLEESANQDDPQAALMAARERFGEPEKLRNELQATVPAVIATVARMDHWIAGRRAGETPLRHASRTGIRISAMIVVPVTLLMILANPEGGQSPGLWMIWPFVAAIGFLFGLNAFVMTICGRAVMNAMTWDEGRIRVRRWGQTASCVVAVGLFLGLSEVAMWFCAGSNWGIADAIVPFAFVTLVGVVSFSAVVGLMAFQQRQLCEWDALCVE